MSGPAAAAAAGGALVLGAHFFFRSAGAERRGEREGSPLLVSAPAHPKNVLLPTPTPLPDHPLLAKAVDLLTATKARVPGVLSLSRSRAAWAPNDPTSAPPLAFEYATLTGALQRAKGKPMLRVPLPSGARVFVFGAVADTDTVVDLLTPLIARAQEEKAAGGGGGGGGGPAAAPAPPPSRAAAAKDKAVADAKAKLLAEDKDLQGLYDQLVGAGVLTDVEFWRGRQDLLRTKLAGGPAAAALATNRQRLGLASALLTEGGPALDGSGPAGNGPSSSAATFRLTPELVHQIFAEKPYVRSAYAAAVPRSVDEPTFWKRYIKYEAARRARRKARAEGRPLAGLPAEDELFRQFRDEARAAGRTADAAAVGGRRIDPAVDLAADAADGAPLPGFGLAHDGRGEPAGGAAKHSVVHDPRDGLAHELNRHAGVVLGGVPADLPEDTAAAARVLKGVPPARRGTVAGGGGVAATAAATAAAPARPPRETTPDDDSAALWRARAASDLADLRPAPEPQYQRLAVTDPRHYFTSAPGGADVALGGALGDMPPPPAPTSLLAAMRSLQDDTPGSATAAALAGAAALMPPSSAIAALRDSAGEGAVPAAADAALLIGGAAVAGTHADPAVALTPALQAVLRQTVLAVNELLRHLWGALPAATPARAARVERVTAALRAQGARVQALQDAATGAEKVHVMRVMKPVEEALGMAFARVESATV